MKKSNEVSAFIWFEELLSKQRYLTGSCFHNSLLYVYEIQKRYAGCNEAYNLLNFIFVLFYFIRSVALENTICLEFHRQQCCIIFFVPVLCVHIFSFSFSCGEREKKEPFLIIEIMITTDFDKIVQSFLPLDIPIIHIQRIGNSNKLLLFVRLSLLCA